MDPLAHTLVGAALAESGLKRLTRGATAALLIGVNLPDVDVVAHLLSDDAALWYRRGWTHGLLAMAVWPPLLSLALYGYYRRRPSGARRQQDGQGLDPGGRQADADEQPGPRGRREAR